MLNELSITVVAYFIAKSGDTIRQYTTALYFVNFSSDSETKVEVNTKKIETIICYNKLRQPLPVTAVSANMSKSSVQYFCVSKCKNKCHALQPINRSSTINHKISDKIIKENTLHKLRGLSLLQSSRRLTRVHSFPPMWRKTQE